MRIGVATVVASAIADGIFNYLVSVIGKLSRQFIIHDWHFVPRAAFAADLLAQDATYTDEEIDEAYRKLLVEVEAVQAEQRKLLTYLIDHHKVRAVYVEGLTDRDLPIFEAIARTLRKVDKSKGETWLRFGAAGQLYVEGKLPAIKPAEEANAYQAANPVNGETVEIDEEAMKRRRQAIVDRLEKEPLAIVVLGVAHDLTPHVAEGTEYIRLTVPSVPADR